MQTEFRAKQKYDPGIGYSVAVSEIDRYEWVAALASCQRVLLLFSIRRQKAEALSPLLVRGLS